VPARQPLKRIGKFTRASEAIHRILRKRHPDKIIDFERKGGISI
jgi:hypothetical protein